ncbi:MAG: hypothetical protein QXK33_04940 [Candidatus Bathyarchaeia archaeon]
MVKEAKTKIYKTNGRHYLYLPKDLITDSNFPLDIKKPIIIRIEGRKLTIENAVL